MNIALPDPKQQVSFARRLVVLRQHGLQSAVLRAAAAVNLTTLDAELAITSPAEGLSAMAGKGLRGELVFATPILLIENPRLLGYYRMVLGYSQKLFYHPRTGLARFRVLEERGVVPEKLLKALPELARTLNLAAHALLLGLGNDLEADLLDDLSLLTLGAQFRGGSNNEMGTHGVDSLLKVITDIVHPALIEKTPTSLVLRNAAQRLVTIEFSADPDIKITEDAGSGRPPRNVVAIEIKAGTDVSNIHNRLGEAEKSHQKAQQAGFRECWTVVNVHALDIAVAKQESPTTLRFYHLANLVSQNGSEYEDFRHNLKILSGLSLH